MATQAQILANRLNSEKSTGPKTPEGKAAVAKNATKHGLFARKDVVISENQAEFDALRDDILIELAPAGTMETILAERIVSLTWRLKRAERMQNEVIEAKIRREINGMAPKLSKSLLTGEPCDVSKCSKDYYDDLALGYIAMWDFAEQRALERLSMYERRFEASLFKTTAELKKLQRMRQSEQIDAHSNLPTTSGSKPAMHDGQDARVTRGRDARDTQGRDALATPCVTRGPDAHDTQCAKQSQSVKNDMPDRSAVGLEELSAFEKREYELLLGAVTNPNEANDSHQKTEVGEQRTEDRGLKTEKSSRRQAHPIDKPVAGVCRY